MHKKKGIFQIFILYYPAFKIWKLNNIFCYNRLQTSIEEKESTFVKLQNELKQTQEELNDVKTQHQKVVFTCI
jgi:hypothetical protein